MNYFNTFKKTYKYFDIQYQKIFYKIFVMVLISSVVELIGIGNLLILISSIVDYQYFEKLILKLAKLTNISSNDLKAILTINNLILICLLIYTFRFTIFIFTEYFLIKSSGQIKRKISYIILTKHLESDFLFFLKQKRNDLIQKIHIETNRFIQMSFKYIRFIAELLFILFLLTSFLIINPKVVFPFILFLSVLLFFYVIIFKKRLKNLGAQRSYYEKKVIESLYNVINGFKEIRINSLNNRFFNFYKIYISNLTNKYNLVMFLNSALRPLVELVFIFLILFFLYFVTNFYDDPTTEIIFLSLVVIRLYPMFNKIVGFLSGIYLPSKSISYMNSVFDIEQETSFNDKSIQNLAFHKEIALKNINFSFPNEKNLYLNEINFKIKKNDIFLIQGESGAGKTTLINILTGLIKPTTGKILIDDRFYIESVKDWNNQISYVSQNFFIFETSLRNNITLFQKNDIDENLYQLSIKMSLCREIEEKIKKQKNEQTDINNTLSGGEKQRISFARAIYANKPILILDEPTSMLDEKNRDQILSNLKELKKSKTIILISHDSEFRKIADDELNLKKI